VIKSNPCLFCGHSDENCSINNEEQEVTSSYQSEYKRKKSSVLNNKHSHRYLNCKKCGLARSETNSNIPILGTINKAIEYREPTEHYENVRQEFDKLLAGKSARNPIGFFGQKASKLANYLSEELKESLIELDIQKATNQKVNILVLTRVIEHIAARDALRKFLDSVKTGGYLFIEMLDFKAMEARGDYSFLWPERCSYPKIDELVVFLGENGYKIEHQKNIDKDKDPFVWLIAKNEWSARRKILGLKAKGSNMGIEIKKGEKIISSNLRDIQNENTQINDIAILGVNHKTLYLLDEIRRIKSVRKIYLYDGSNQKIWSYYDEIPVLSIQDAGKERVDLCITSFHNELSEAIIQKIKKKDKNAVVYSCDELFRKTK
jgi:hypothetical protein